MTNCLCSNIAMRYFCAIFYTNCWSVLFLRLFPFMALWSGTPKHVLFTLKHFSCLWTFLLVMIWCNCFLISQICWKLHICSSWGFTNFAIWQIWNATILKQSVNSSSGYREKIASKFGYIDEFGYIDNTQHFGKRIGGWKH